MNVFCIKFLGIHVLTLVLLIVCFTLTYYKLKIPFLHRMTIAGIVTMIGVWFYDLIWLLFRDFSINYPRFFITIFFLQMLLVYNYVFKFRFLHLNKFFIISLLLFFITMIGMDMTGWFLAFEAWAVNQSLPDPHNWLWGASKITGLLMWSFLIKRQNTGIRKNDVTK